MSKGVFLHRADSIYEDEPDRQYQFPASYLSRAKQCEGDWIIFLQPTKAGRRGYHAIAQVQKIVADPVVSGMYLALIEPGSYLEFDRDVPFRDGANYPESGVLNDSGKVSGRAQSAMRPISEDDFNRIVARGIASDDDFLPRAGGYDARTSDAFVSETPSPFDFAQSRERMAYLTSRLVRDRVFRSRVLKAYDSRCAFTGLKFINGGGRAETEAAHIRPVQHSGPDAPNNGIALSGTVHWMFDRGLLSLSDSMEILVSRSINDRDGLDKMLVSSRRALVPTETHLRPHSRFLAWHRDNCFKA